MGFAMRLAEAWTADFDHETSVTRLLLERLPESALAWRPHEKSFSLAELATHLSRVVEWGVPILEHPSYDLASSSGTRRPALESRGAIVAAFDAAAARLRARVVDLSDAELHAPWELRRGGHLVLVMPRFAALRRFALHHLIHHRGQLTVYLRLHDVPLPPLYGPTADEGA